MKRMRHGILAFALGLFSLAASAQTASRPLRILVPFSAGGASDTYTRIAALKIAEQTGKSFVVENRTGAGGRIAWEAAAKSAPDGATAALIDATYPMLPGLFEKLPWDVASDLVPAAMICQTPFVVTVGAGSKLESLAALIAGARGEHGAKIARASRRADRFGAGRRLRRHQLVRVRVSEGHAEGSGQYFARRSRAGARGSGRSREARRNGRRAVELHTRGIRAVFEGRHAQMDRDHQGERDQGGAVT